jgi:diguanylate cyclase (GGDEF)-like protein
MSTQMLADAVIAVCVLIAFTTGLRSIVRLVRSARASEDRLGRLEQLASTDDLTGLPNRRHWDEQLPRELGRSLRHEGPICVAMLDLDHFKAYNDTHGHQAGDRLLKEVAAAWRAVLRPYDLLARYGGEEFSLILTDSGIEDATWITERLRVATPHGTSCSVGIAEWNRDEDPGALVERADQALYEAKRGGRNRTVAMPLAH